jgi:hypothetical protein
MAGKAMAKLKPGLNQFIYQCHKRLAVDGFPEEPVRTLAQVEPFRVRVGLPVMMMTGVSQRLPLTRWRSSARSSASSLGR